MSKLSDIVPSNRRHFAALAFTAFLCGCNSGPAPMTKADAEAAARGRDYAETNCARCHAVSRDETSSPMATAPSFRSLALKPEMTRMALAGLLRAPHKQMPALIVPADRIDDLAAYLEDLKPSDI